jgi:hypothetical protein
VVYYDQQHFSSQELALYFDLFSEGNQVQTPYFALAEDLIHSWWSARFKQSLQ